MKEKKTETLTVLKVTRLNNSCYGNPRFQLVLVNDEMNCIIAKTVPNGLVGYCVTYSMEKEKKSITYYTTKRGAYIVTDIN